MNSQEVKAFSDEESSFEFYRTAIFGNITDSNNIVLCLRCKDKANLQTQCSQVLNFTKIIHIGRPCGLCDQKSCCVDRLA